MMERVGIVERLSSRFGVSLLRLRDNIDGWLFVLPAVLGTLAFTFYPVLSSLVSSFTVWDGVTPRQFCGIQNYVSMFTLDSVYIKALRNTTTFTLGKIPFTLLISFILALLTNRDVKLNVFFRTAYYTPVITSTIAVAMVWRWLLAGQFGVVNYFLGLVGISGPKWLSDPSWTMIAVIIVSVWRSVGYPMIIYLAALQGIPETLYEAADIDGATSVQKLFKITIPLVSPSTFFIVILQFIGPAGRNLARSGTLRRQDAYPSGCRHGSRRLPCERRLHRGL